MDALSFLYYVVAISVIIIALAIVAVSVGIVVVLYEVRKMMRAVSSDIRHVKDSFQSGMIGNAISFGKSIFQKKPRND